MIPNEKTPCLKCKLCNSNGLFLFCKAFESGVPDEIINGENDHTEPLPNQENNIIFEPINEQEQ